jgi:hypothetical protein
MSLVFAIQECFQSEIIILFLLNALGPRTPVYLLDVIERNGAINNCRISRKNKEYIPHLITLSF